MKSRTAVILFLILIAAAAIGLWWWRTMQAGQGPATLTPVTFADIPGWNESDQSAALAAFRRSCAEIAHRPDDKETFFHTHVADWRAPCAQAATASDARSFFEANFNPFSVGDGLVTGYYEALVNASRKRHGRYQTPVYGRPNDLVSVDLGAFKPELSGQKIEGRVQGQRLVPYPARADIDAHPPKDAPVLMWADDPIDVFFLHIQGSGRARLDDGTVLRLSYDGQNGQPYTSVARVLIEDYGLSRDGMSMQVIRQWLRDHPAELRHVLERDASFVFFKAEAVGDPKLGPQGSEGVLLTPHASIAVDAKFNPFGLPVFIAGGPTTGLYIAQDTGGAIRGPVRADLFFGFGSEAERDAGGLKAHPDFYFLLPKPRT